MFNGAIDLFSLALIVLTAFQLVYMCYLYLMGPLAAAFFAWPTVQGRLFRTVFGNWVNAVIMLALWRFYWMVILAIMTQRLMYISERGGQFDLQWEVAVFTCLVGLMFYIPMNPWNFDPAQAYQAATQIGSQMMNAGGGNGGGDGAEAANMEGPLANAVHDLPDGEGAEQRGPMVASRSGAQDEETVTETPPPVESYAYTSYDADGNVENGINGDNLGDPPGDAPPIERLANLDLNDNDGDFAIPGIQVAALETGPPSLMPDGDGSQNSLAFESNPNVERGDVDKGQADVSSILGGTAVAYEAPPTMQGEGDTGVSSGNPDNQRRAPDEVQV
jgi:hypothetical protein